ncbi:uncharacterized protein L969DRAFT_85831 [Mixia osmundae IAM 14324]|uniref:Pyridoxamine kinase/Phosphomethylpyrimidine kinase domain-containing protein n=1 Tax=Mixia osmundae (strain CBS 9802 / IAM 14324 / JCM 22182 / KY 12970) TaxID=764103 RepID=G7E5W6_MIXOS|nr:uncharacterized protein L969DRAFT_85831 [Mixia osmundae IAM 14324]KEI40622.1 hypothetical protein L969DRAFT_85831 [Mixia osmundae IAM 14324]GAA98226.1 hypothetical protein E5Q_04909 [Mixia osmundae IAM 14324]
MAPVRTLTIAGSDSGGGAGIQADLKTFTSLGTYGLTVITALTAQNTLGVDAIEAVSPAFVRQQLKSVLSDLGADCIKTGMLANKDIINAIADALDETYGAQWPALIVDPVMVSTSGHKLLEDDAIDALKTRLLPHATLVTPNMPEAKILASLDTRDIDGLADEELMQRYCQAIAGAGCDVIVKGGHLKGDIVLDLLFQHEDDSFTRIEHSRIETTSSHGTGCTLSAAICAYYAQTHNVEQSVRSASGYVHRALATAYPMGSGHGPVHHTHSIEHRIVPLPTAQDPFPFTSMLIESCDDLWQRYTRTNAFVRGIQTGKLPVSAFVYFLRQDYLFLLQYARIFLLAIFKSTTLEEMQEAAQTVLNIFREASMHIERCKKWGITEQEFHQTREAFHTVGYTRFVMSESTKGGLLELKLATAPCLIGYGVIGKVLAADPATNTTSNPYLEWIHEYAGEDFQHAVVLGQSSLEKIGRKLVGSTEAFENAKAIFREAVKLEIAFFEQALQEHPEDQEIEHEYVPANCASATRAPQTKLHAVLSTPFMSTSDTFMSGRCSKNASEAFISQTYIMSLCLARCIAMSLSKELSRFDPDVPTLVGHCLGTAASIRQLAQDRGVADVSNAQPSDITSAYCGWLIDIAVSRPRRYIQIAMSLRLQEQEIMSLRKSINRAGQHYPCQGDEEAQQIATHENAARFERAFADQFALC